MLAEAGGRLAASLPLGSEGAVQPSSQDWVPPEQRSAGAAEKAKENLAACLKVLDGGLEAKAFLLGEYSLADTHLQGFVGWLGMMGVDLRSFPNVTGWMKRCGERPALAALMTN